MMFYFLFFVASFIKFAPLLKLFTANSKHPDEVPSSAFNHLVYLDGIFQ